MMHHDITGVVLAGGLSSRIGSDKALMEFRGVPLVTYAVSILQQVCGKVVISSNRRDYLFTGCEIWPDETDIQAPMIGIFSCLKRVLDEWIMVLSCDMPLVDPRVFNLLISQANDHKCDVVAPVHDGNSVEPLCGLYNRRVIPLFKRSIEAEQYSLQQFIRNSKHRLVRVDQFLDFYRPNMFFNINSPEDFGLLK
jgi:molybdenum cofactor guanylyltransferase